MNQKRYWLRGGLYGLALSVLIFLVATLADDPNWQGLLLFAFPIIAPFPIVIGIVLGWLYGKFKNRNIK